MARKGKTAEMPTEVANLKAAEPKPISEQARRIAESRTALKQPLQPGQAFFEAPDGYIIIAEASRGHVLYRPFGGQEILINPRREP